MRPQDCPSFDNCDAPLCPLGRELGWLEDAAWFPGEAICNRQAEKPRWVDVQRRIDKATGGDRKRGFFTLRMLEALTAVTPAIEGIDVDTKDESRDIERWCANRTRRILTEKDIEWSRTLGRVHGKHFPRKQARPKDAPSEIGTPGHVEE